MKKHIPIEDIPTKKYEPKEIPYEQLLANSAKKSKKSPKSINSMSDLSPLQLAQREAQLEQKHDDLQQIIEHIEKLDEMVTKFRANHKATLNFIGINSVIEYLFRQIEVIEIERNKINAGSKLSIGNIKRQPTKQELNWTPTPSNQTPPPLPKE